MRIIFMGTPDFSVPALETLIKSRHEVAAVVTQPDKPRGRGRAVGMSPVKECALAHGIPVYQPMRARDEDFVELVKGLAPDVCVVVAFGQILPRELLEAPRYGCVNLHGSLLPKYRGASPIQWSVINGDEVGGLTTMLMDEGMDTGDMLEKLVVRLDPKETGGSLFCRLSLLGGDLILSTLEKLEAGAITRTPQDHGQATYVKKIPKSMGEIDWTMDVLQIERLVRGLNPWPSAYTYYKGKMLKIWEAEAVLGGGLAGGTPLGLEVSGPPGDEAEEAAAGKDRCGVVLEASGSRLEVRAGNGILRILGLQLEGKKRMDTASFLRGFTVEEGARLGRVL